MVLYQHVGDVASIQYDARRFVGILHHQASMRQHAHVMEREMEEAKRAHKVVTQVASAEEVRSLSILRQGNEDLNTEEVLMQRLALRDAPEIRSVLADFWRIAQFEMLQRASDGNNLIGDSTLDRTGYTLLYERVHSVLLPTEEAAEMAESIAEDWEHDAKGAADAIDERAFGDTLFELADVWVPTCDLCDYEEFLRRLLTSIVDGDEHGTRPAYKTLEACIHDVDQLSRHHATVANVVTHHGHQHHAHGAFKGHHHGSPPHSRHHDHHVSLPRTSRHHDHHGSLPHTSRHHNNHGSLPRTSRHHDNHGSLPRTIHHHDNHGKPHHSLYHDQHGSPPHTSRDHDHHGSPHYHDHRSQHGSRPHSRHHDHRGQHQSGSLSHREFQSESYEQFDYSNVKGRLKTWNYVYIKYLKWRHAHELAGDLLSRLEATPAHAKAHKHHIHVSSGSTRQRRHLHKIYRHHIHEHHIHRNYDQPWNIHGRVEPRLSQYLTPAALHRSDDQPRPWLQTPCPLNMIPPKPHKLTTSLPANYPRFYQPRQPQQPVPRPAQWWMTHGQLMRAFGDMASVHHVQRMQAARREHEAVRSSERCGGAWLP